MNRDIERALDNLEKRVQDIQHYVNIMDKIKKVNVSCDLDFQREYNYFYKVRRNAEWRQHYFDLFEKCKKRRNVSFGFILEELYSNTGRVEASFASKMLASLDDDMPIWNSQVLNRMGISPSKKQDQQKINETKALYYFIVDWYEKLKADKDRYEEYVTAFDNRFPDYSNISSTKKIDFILWAMDDGDEEAIPSVYIKNMKALSNATQIVSRSIDAYLGVMAAAEQKANCMAQYQVMLDTVVEKARLISKSLQPIFDYQQQIVENIRQALESLGKKFADISEMIPKIEIPDSCLKILGNIEYLHILKKTNWPLFLEDDEEIKEIITGLCAEHGDEYPLDELSDIICRYYSAEKIDSFMKGWKALLKDDHERQLLLEEAIRLHKAGYYYGSTSLMMCQVDGLICDISNYANENGFVCSEEDEEVICNYYKVDFAKHKEYVKKKKEKHLILRLAAMTENAPLYWEAVTDYIYNVVLTSQGNEYREHNPLRNKICHGDQMDFGTEEKSLKSILTIDLLLNLKSEMKWIAEAKKEK